MNFSTPILFLIFSRPDLTARVFARIREIKPKYLYIAADGPRHGREGEAELCAETRIVVNQIDWDCEVNHLYRDQNLGCRVAISSAITWFFENVSEGIILEDDCLPDLSFFHYCEELLLRHRYDQEIGAISGFSGHNNNCQCQEPATSYCFSKYPFIWGWATWARTWKHYDVNMPNWTGDADQIKDWLTNWGYRRMMKKNFDKVKFQNLSTWDYQLLYLFCQTKQIAILPKVNLVENIGFFDERSTHPLSGEEVSKFPCVRQMQFPLVHPEVVRIDLKRELCIESTYDYPKSILSIPFRWLAARIKSFV